MSFSPYFRIIAAFILALGGSRAYATGSETAGITYAEHIRPILERSCVNCHQPGQIGPMPLRTYDEVRPWAKSIKTAVSGGTMPPFHAAGPVGRYLDDPRLSGEQIQSIVRWVDQGCPPGPVVAETEVVPPADASGTWSLGEPDLILETWPHKVRPGATDDYTLHFLDFVFPEDLWIGGVEFQNEEGGLVHHANLVTLSSMETVEARVMEASERVEGDDMRALRRKSQLRNSLPELRKTLERVEAGELRHITDVPVLGNTIQLFMGPSVYGWLPGMTPRMFRTSDSKFVSKGSRLALECHYAPRDVAAVAQTKIGIYLLDGEITEARGGDLSSIEDQPPIILEPGQSDYRRTYESVLQTDALIDTFTLHMHYRGKSGDIRLVYPNGRSETVFEIPRYDFNWQRPYTLVEPILAPKGTRVIHSATWDNSAANPYNPDPSQRVVSGMRTTDEMWASAIQYTIPGALKKSFLIRDGRLVDRPTVNADRD